MPSIVEKNYVLRDQDIFFSCDEPEAKYWPCAIVHDSVITQGDKAYFYHLPLRLVGVPSNFHYKIPLLGDKIVDNSDVVGASPVEAAPTTSSFSTLHLALMDWAKTIPGRDVKHLSFGIWRVSYSRFDGIYIWYRF